MVIVGLLTAMLTSMRADVPVGVMRGATLLRACRAEMQLMQPGALQRAEQGDLINGSYCVGYLNGFLANVAGTHTSICTEQEPMAALVAAYVLFMERNPQLLEEDKRVGVRFALESAFPCPAVSGSDLGSLRRRDRL